MTSFQCSELTELPAEENSHLFAQRAHDACTVHGTTPVPLTIIACRSDQQLSWTGCQNAELLRVSPSLKKKGTTNKEYKLLYYDSKVHVLRVASAVVSGTKQHNPGTK